MWTGWNNTEHCVTKKCKTMTHFKPCLVREREKIIKNNDSCTYNFVLFIYKQETAYNLSGWGGGGGGERSRGVRGVSCKQW